MAPEDSNFRKREEVCRRVAPDLSLEKLKQLADYLQNPFQLEDLPEELDFPRPDEPHLEAWRDYREETETRSVLAVLQARLQQLNFPVREDISETEAYRNVARRGEYFADQQGEDKLELEEPGSLELKIYEHPAGSLPVLVSPGRADFVKLYRALGHRGEPVDVGPAVNAQMVSGLNNWDRVKRYKQNWLEANSAGFLDKNWTAEFKRIAGEEPEQFRDRLVLVHKSPYSGMDAEALELELTEEQWRDRSLTIRIEHEFTHYFTRRVFGQMAKHPWDELLADYRGLLAGLGEFEADLFLKLFGVVGDSFRDEARAHTYLEELDPALYQPLVGILKRAAENLETISRNHPEQADEPEFLLALCTLGLDLLAHEKAGKIFAERLEKINQ